MNDLGTIGLTFFYLVLLIVPGIIGIDIYFRRSKKRDNFGRLRAVVYSVFLGLLSLVTLYILTPIYFGLITNLSDDISDLIGLVTASEIFNLSLANIVSIYMIHFILAVLIGYGVGLLDDKVLNRNEVNDRRDPWTYTFSEVAGDEERIRVVTDDGDVFEGAWNERAWSKTQSDLYLEEVEQISPSVEEVHPGEIGRGIYIHQQSVSHVIFTEQDPDSGSYDEEDREPSGIEEALPEEGSDISVDSEGEEDEEDISDQGQEQNQEPSLAERVRSLGYKLSGSGESQDSADLIR